ncbi:unnamed protein product [Paramecium sonneborni]|uniref:Uncharacterized protein n=1 Tax=Paramecium sonneborni TaxID=65129 RepID=A0A8S1MDU0_9CILI|nr:unnamed protein product [Paramecium sonneborni]
MTINNFQKIEINLLIKKRNIVKEEAELNKTCLQFERLKENITYPSI